MVINVIIGKGLEEFDGFGLMIVPPPRRLGLTRPVHGSVFGVPVVEGFPVLIVPRIVQSLHQLHIVFDAHFYLLQGSLFGWFSLKPLGEISDWEAPPTPYGNEANAKTDDSSNHGHYSRRKVQHMAYHHHGGASERGNSVKFGMQNGRDLGDQYVAQHAAADPGQHTKQCGHQRVETIAKRLM